MKHINKKFLIQGAGKSKPKPKPAILKPPKLGGFKPVASYGVAEIIDLISDGPIEGLVDQNGSKVKQNLFKGIYLDNIPVQNSSSLSTQTNNTNTTYDEVDISSVIKPLGDVYVKSKRMAETPYILEQGVSKGGHKFTIFATDAATIQVNWLQMTRATYFNLKNNNVINTKVELHIGHPLNPNASNIIPEYKITSPTASVILKDFKNHVTQQVNNSNERIKSIASDNVKQLNLLENVMNEAFVITQGRSKIVPGRIATGFIVIDISSFKFAASKMPSSDVDMTFFIKGLTDKFDYIFTLVQPVVSNGVYTGDIKGVIIIAAPLRIFYRPKKGYAYYYFPPALINTISKGGFNLVASSPSSAPNENAESYNFSNVSCEFKNGSEFQSSLAGFKNIANDYVYETKLAGPYNTKPNLSVQRILINKNDTKFQLGAAGLDSNNLSVSISSVIAGTEGSHDIRKPASTDLNYSNWNDSNEKADYNSVGVTHVIENPLVDSVSLTLTVQNLSDTVHVDVSGIAGVDGKKLDAGSKIPAIVIIRVETGKITNEIKTERKTYTYSIVGLIESGCSIDFGADYPEADNLLKEVVKLIGTDNALKDTPLTPAFDIPALAADENPSTTKRYITITKLSAETNSVLLNKELAVSKITEITNQRLSYPFSAIAGIKLDARSFSSIPDRSYDCKLKLVKIPSNYKIYDKVTGLDIRYVKNAANYTTQQSIYIGDWDGSFVEGWTDNPAWILYDLLTSKRYGLGAYIDESQINKWELYKIARFCDAVDENGNFIGVSDGVGGLEPRFSCNIIFKEQTKVYDAINVVANLFRGIVFFGGSEIHFLDDRPRVPIALFNNANIKDGIFNYSNIRRDLQFNTVEVVYLDRFDNYKTKVEYVQDEQDIRKRGVFKTTINTSGVTSRAMARRIGQHIIYQTIKENQTVDFAAGLEALLCRPGDLIIIEDEMKTRAINYGRILEVNTTNKTLRIDNQFISGQYTGFVTIYSPTGYSSSSELEDIANINRSRVDQFTINSALFSNTNLTGVYKFSGYTSGFSNSLIYPQQFPLYTGRHVNGHSLFCYYNTGATGFVFATGLAFTNNSIYDKVITNTGVFFAADIAPLELDEEFENGGTLFHSPNYTGFAYNPSVANRRGASQAISGSIDWNRDLFPKTSGILDREIDTYDISQITKISLTGYDNEIGYGSLLYMNQNDPNVKFLAAVKPGSIYRIERKSASDQIYKIISIRENSQNEYGVTASRYDTGKFETIEKAITSDFLENTYYNGPIVVNNVQVNQLNTPNITQFAAQNQNSLGFELNAQWGSVANATGFEVTINNSLAGYLKSQRITSNSILFNGLTDIGNWNLSVRALAANPRIDSSTATTGAFIAYNGSFNTTDKPVIQSFTLV